MGLGAMVLALAWLSQPTPIAAQTAPSLKVARDTLTNGLRVIIVRNPLAPVVTTVINYRVGSDETPPGFPGTAHAQEHMMFRGSPDLDAAQLANITAAIGGEFDADTQQAVTQYFFTTPKQDTEIAWRIESIRMRGVLDSEDLWGQERGAIEQEVAQDLSNPEYLFYSQMLAALFKGTPYEHDALGTRPSFDKTTGQALKQFYQTWYVPNNAILIVVGDVDPDAALAKIRELFEPIPSKTLPERPAFNFQPVAPKTIELDTDLPYGLAVFAFRFPGSDSADYAAGQVLADVLSSQRGKLYDLVPQGKALSADFSSDALPHAGMGYASVGYPSGANAQALLKEMRRILESELTNGLPLDLVEAAKRREVTSNELQKNSVPGLAMAWSQAVAVEGRNSPDEDIEAIRRVTLDDVNRVARQYLNFNQAITAILTPQPSGKSVPTKGFGGKESLTPAPSKGVSIPEWAQARLQKLEIPASSLQPISNTLPNGLKLIIQSISNNDTVSVYGQVKDNPNVETPKGKEGVDQVFDELFSYGSKTLDRLAFQKAVDEIGAIESAGNDFSLQVLAEHFDRGVQLLADNQLSPALPAKAFKTIQPQLAAAVSGQRQSAGYREARAISAALFPKRDPVQREATPRSIKKLSLADVTNYYQHVFRPDLTTIVVIGNVNPDKAAKVISQYFGGWKATGPKPETLLPPAPNNKSAVVRVPDISRVQDKITLTETLALVRTNADYYALELGNHVLGGGFYATRLYRDLRENAGLVYYVGVALEAGQTRSIFKLDYACDPANVSKARSLAVANLKSMRTAEVTPEELQQAKAQLLRQIPLSESSVERIAQGWIYRSLHDLPLEEPVLAARRYYQLTAPEVQAAWSKWLRPDDLVQVTLGPEPK